MKILQLIYDIGPGGAERFVVDLCNEFIKSGNEVYLYILRDDDIAENGFYKGELSEKIVYKSLKIKEGFNPWNAYILGKIIKKINPEVVHCHQNLVNYVFPLTAIFNKIKFFQTIHNDAQKELSGKLEYWIRKFFYISKRMKAITISDETSKSFIKCYKSNQFTQIYNGRKMPVPSEKFESVKDFINSLRNGNVEIFLHIGRFAVQKNQQMLINVFNRLIKEGKSVVLIVIGDGFDSENGKEFKIKVSDKVLFLGSVHNVADYYLNVDAFCLSSKYEGMPITVIEALACGCTPICTPVGGIIDAIENGVTGFLSKTISEEDYYQAVIDFMNHKERINKDKLIENYKKRFSIEECANQYIKLYKE